MISVQISQGDGAGDPARVALALRSGLWLCTLGGLAAALLMLAIYPLLGPLGQPPEVLAILLPYWASMAVWIIPFTVFFGLKSLWDAIDRPWVAVGLSYIGVVVNVPAAQVRDGVEAVVGLALSSEISRLGRDTIRFDRWLGDSETGPSAGAVV